jgi:hypothetical protein
LCLHETISEAKASVPLPRGFRSVTGPARYMLNQSESIASSESFVPRLRRHAAPVSREPGSVSSAAAAQPRAVPASPTGFGCRLLPLLCAFTVVLGMLGALSQSPFAR